MTEDKQKGNSRDSKGRFLPDIVPEGSSPFVPGESGNLAGRPPNSVTTLLKEKDRQGVADKLYQMALAGDLGAIREYLDRTEGRVGDKLKIEGDVPTVINFIAVKDRPEGFHEDATE